MVVYYVKVTEKVGGCSERVRRVRTHWQMRVWRDVSENRDLGMHLDCALHDVLVKRVRGTTVTPNKSEKQAILGCIRMLCVLFCLCAVASA